MSLALTSPSSLRATLAHPAQLSSRVFVLLASLLTLALVVADQFAAPVLYSSSPLWATAMCLILVWRRSPPNIPVHPDSDRFCFSPLRVVIFAAAHLILVSAALKLDYVLHPFAGASSAGGWLVAFMKLLVLAPTLALLPLSRWRIVWRNYRAECAAAAIVLFTFFPARIFDAVWPWYGQLLGKLCFSLAHIFVPSLTYAASLTPTLNGPDLDLTILPACSGLSGVELFDGLAALVAVVDWNCLRKGRATLVYLGGLLAMLLGNALRITTLVVLGNRGLADFVARYHVAAGSLFFSLVFLVYLAATYRFLLRPRELRPS